MIEAILRETDTMISLDDAVEQVRAGTLDKGAFTCPSCGVDVQLCSFRKENVVAPYFRVTHTQEGHEDDCAVEKGTYESRGAGPQSKSSQSKSPSRKNTAKSDDFDLRDTVLAYHRDPQLQSKPLKVPGVEASTYREAFHKLNCERDKETGEWLGADFDGRYIYFGVLSYVRPVKKRGTTLTAEFLQQAARGNPYHLEIDTQDWDATTASDLYATLDTAQCVARRGGGKALAFVVTQLNPGDSILHVQDPKHICVLSTQDHRGLDKLPWSKKGRTLVKPSEMTSEVEMESSTEGGEKGNETGGLLSAVKSLWGRVTKLGSE